MDTVSKNLRPSNLADVLARVQGSADLTQRQKAQFSFAVRKVGKVAGRSLGELPADPRDLMRIVRERPPISWGRTKSSRQSFESKLKAALRVAGIPVRGRRVVPLSIHWQHLAQTLPKSDLCALSRFMSYASESGIEPGDVDDAFAARFRSMIETSGLTFSAKPNTYMRRVCKSWNEAVAANRVTARNPLAVPSCRAKFALPESECGRILAEYEALACPPGPRRLLATVRYHAVKPLTIRARKYHLRTCAAAAQAKGYVVADLTLSQLTDLPVFTDILECLLTRNGGNPSKQIWGIACFLKSIARALGVAASEQEKLRIICNNLCPGPREMGIRSRTRMSQFDSEQNVDALLCLAERLVRDARSARTEKRKLRLLECALKIDLLIATSMRLGNLSRLRRDRHIIRSSNGREVQIHIPAEEVKNGVELSYSLRPRTIRLLDSYLKCLDGISINPSPWLFPGARNGHEHQLTTWADVRKTIRRYIGLDVHPHLFRHITAKLYMQEHSNGHHTVRDAHGGKSIDVTNRHYIGRDTRRAAAELDRVIEDRRNHPSSTVMRRHSKSRRNKSRL